MFLLSECFIILLMLLRRREYKKKDTSEALRFITIESRSFGNNTKIMLEPRLSRPRLEAPFIKPTAQVIDFFRGLATYRAMLALFFFLVLINLPVLFSSPLCCHCACHPPPGHT